MEQNYAPYYFMHIQADETSHFKLLSAGLIIKLLKGRFSPVLAVLILSVYVNFSKLCYYEILRTRSS